MYFQTFIPQEVDKNEKSFGFRKKNLGSYTDIENKPWFRFPILKPNFCLTLLQSTVYCIHLIANNDGAALVPDPLACFEKWLSPDFTCQKVEEAQKVSLKGCASAILLHHYKSSRPRWIVRRCMAQWVEISSEIVLFFLMNLKSFPEIKLDFLYIVASALNFLPWEFLLVKKLEIQKNKTTKYTTFKADIIKVVLVFSISDFFSNENSQGRKLSAV